MGRDGEEAVRDICATLQSVLGLQRLCLRHEESREYLERSAWSSPEHLAPLLCLSSGFLEQNPRGFSISHPGLGIFHALPRCASSSHNTQLLTCSTKTPHPCRIQVLRPQQTREISNQTAIINGFISIPMPQTFSTSHPFHNDAVSKSGARLSAHSQFLSTQRKKIANFFSCQHALCNTQWVILVPNAASTESWEIRWVPSSP